MKRRFCILICAAASISCALAQGIGAPRDLRFLTETSPVLTYSNAAALYTLGEGKTSMAELVTDKGNGGLVPIEGSADDLEVSALTESYSRISDKIAFHGLLSYSYYTGREMGGPVLMNPIFNPVNFYESSTDNLGTRNHEYYHAIGDMSYKLGNKWAIGLGFDYESGDQVKIKDPRTQSKWMDLRVSPALWFQASNKWGLGLALKYRNTLEQVKGGIFGTTDKQYFILADKGNFFGSSEELAGDYNYLPENNSRPLSNTFYGASIQAYKTGKLRLASELSVMYRSGYYGKKSSSTPTFFEFGGIEADYNFSALFQSGQALHKLAMSASLETLSCLENLFRYVTPSGQNTEVQYTGTIDLTNRMILDAGLSYKGWAGISGIRPSLEWGAAVKARYLDNKMTYYPRYRNHDHFNIDAEADVEKNFVSSRGMLTIGTQIGFFTGGGTIFEDGSHAQSSTSLFSFDNYIYRQFEYDTASRAGVSLSIGYTRFFSKTMAAYVKLSDSFVSMISEPQYLDNGKRNCACLTIGCLF